MKQRYVLLILALFAVSMNLRPAITSISPLLQDIRQDLGMNGTAASFLTALPVLCMGLFAPAATSLEQRWGMKPVVAGCLLLIGAATAARLVAVHTGWLLLTAGLIGIGIAIAGPLLSGFIKMYFPNRAGAMVGIYTLGMGAGASLGAGMAVPLQQAFGFWSSSLAVWALLAGAALLIWLAIVPTGKQAARAAGGKLPWRTPRAWLITLFFGLQSALFYAATAWLAPYLRSLGFGAGEAGLVVTGFSLLQMFFCFLIPNLSEKTPRRRPWLLASSTAALAGFLLLLAVPMVSVWLAVVFLSTGLGGLFPLALLLPLDETDTPAAASAWTAMASSAGYAIGSIGPILVGTLLDLSGSFHFALASVLLLCVAMILCSLPLGTRARK
ncbi:MFS transporter [Ectobacillus ponti]|uniref:MFS transporter n=1 Tax=Ectobacillus ponti TaxID=2961894 RepID=A0AA42BSB0_9BACI|nr:MFS transporter [Ectobacillus ponti]MCP8970374.1 MFS transporter [Ectobacillus ponti]